MTENLQGELSQLGKKHEKGAKLGTNIRKEMEGKRCFKTFFKALSPCDRSQISINLGTKHVI